MLIAELTPPSREQSVALTKLDEVTFWANAGIARNCVMTALMVLLVLLSELVQLSMMTSYRDGKASTMYGLQPSDTVFANSGYAYCETVL